MAKLNLQLNEIWKPHNNLGIKFTCDDVARVVVRIVGRQTHAFELLHLHVVTILQEWKKFTSSTLRQKTRRRNGRLLNEKKNIAQMAKSTAYYNV